MGAEVEEALFLPAPLFLNEASAEEDDAEVEFETPSAAAAAAVLAPREMFGDCDRGTAGDALLVELPPDLRLPVGNDDGSLSVLIASSSNPLAVAFEAVAAAALFAAAALPFFLSP